MDFFREQRLRRRRSAILYMLFFAVVFAHGLVLALLSWLLLTIFNGGMFRQFVWMMVLVTVGMFAIGSWLEFRRLREGGRAIARRVGAVRLFIDQSQDHLSYSRGIDYDGGIAAARVLPATSNLLTTNILSPTLPSALSTALTSHSPSDEAHSSSLRFTPTSISVRHPSDFPTVYRRLYEVCDQLAIAAGIRAPLLYVLPHEMGINAFVAGYSEVDTVLVVTQGALEKLSDEALYGLIGHEYGHIIQGDNRFNIKLMVVLAGLQWLYDWSDPVEHHRSSNVYEELVNRQSSGVPQQWIDEQAKKIQAQTASFTSANEWVNYWRSQAQLSGHAPKGSVGSGHAHWTVPLSSRDDGDHGSASLGFALVHTVSFSSMACAQLIKHSFNRERELLADAISVQLTRSNAILATLKAIAQDPIGSRLVNTPDIHSLSHFFFASSGLDLGDSSWFATHPSLNARMQAVNAGEYADYAAAVARERQQQAKMRAEIHEAQRRGTWQAYKMPLDSSNTPVGLDLEPSEDKVIDGRLDTSDFAQALAAQTGRLDALLPHNAKPNVNLPKGMPINRTHLEKVTLPQRFIEQMHRATGAVALIESLMLAHSQPMLWQQQTYDFAQIWLGFPISRSDISRHQPAPVLDTSQSETLAAAQASIGAHQIQSELLTSVVATDRRMDSAIIETALIALSRQRLNVPYLAALAQAAEISLTRYEDMQQHQRLCRARNTIILYQKNLSRWIKQLKQSIKTEDRIASDNTHHLCVAHPLWQAVHFYGLVLVLEQLVPITGSDTDMLDMDSPISLLASLSIPTLHLLHHDGNTSSSRTDGNMDGSSASLDKLAFDNDMMLLLTGIVVAQDRRSTTRLAKENMAAEDSQAKQLVTIRRMGALMSVTLPDEQLRTHIELCQMPQAMLWLVASIHRIRQYAQLAQDDGLAQRRLRGWLSTLHTAALSDTKLSQDEYDVLSLLAKYWLGKRELID